MAKVRFYIFKTKFHQTSDDPIGEYQSWLEKAQDTLENFDVISACPGHTSHDRYYVLVTYRTSSEKPFVEPYD